MFHKYFILKLIFWNKMMMQIKHLIIGLVSQYWKTEYANEQ